MAQRVIKVGMMSFAHMHAGSYAHSIVSRPEIELVGIADHDQNRAEAMAKQFETKAFENYTALLESPGLDAVVICPENRLHRELTELAAVDRPE